METSFYQMNKFENINKFQSNNWLFLNKLLKTIFDVNYY